MRNEPDRPSPHVLDRLLRPSRVAVVGATDAQPRARSVVSSLQSAGVEFNLVHPRRETVLGIPTVPSLDEVDGPIDAVLALVRASAAVDVVGDAARLGMGGVVVTADGFDAAKSALLVEAAGDAMPMIGPNCNGYVDAQRGVRLSGAPALPLMAGPVALVTHSGGLIASIGSAGAERGIGFTHLISTGNELRVGIADCLDFLVQDPATQVILLVVESLRQPAEFFAAVDRAVAQGKPVIALKLGRTETSQRIARSHTGAITGEDWVYRAAFAQHGVQLADDIPELLDRASCFAQLPPRRWSNADAVAVIGSSGGWAALAGDIADDEGIELPTLGAPLAELRDLLPTTTVANPLDMTGGLTNDDEAISRILTSYVDDGEVDLVLSMWFLDDAGLELGGALVRQTRALAESRPDLAVMLASIEDTRIGATARELVEHEVALGRGLRPAMRGIASMRAFRRYRQRGPRSLRRDAVQAAPPPDRVIDSSAGPMLPFGDAMRLLGQFGFDVADFCLIEVDDTVDAATFDADRYVVKLADVPHRTELGAVRVGVSPREIPETVTALRALAADAGLPPTVVVQQQVAIDGEVLLGADTTSELGAFVVCGPGGVFVEMVKAPGGAVCPLADVDIDVVLRPIDDLGLFEHVRGSTPWDRDLLGDAVLAMGALAESCQGWLTTLEINPLVYSDGRLVALDCLALVRPTTLD